MQMDRKTLVQKIIDQEVQRETARSSGAGGQHVNKNETKVILVREALHTKNLSEEQIERLQNEYKNKISKEWLLRVSSQRYRSQIRNKEDVIHKFGMIIHSLFEQKKERKYRKKIPRREKEKRLSTKKKRSYIKQLRRKDLE